MPRERQSRPAGNGAATLSVGDGSILPLGCDIRGCAVRGSDWERAAIVAAHCREGEQHDNRNVEAESSLYTFREFAALGLAGLKSKDALLVGAPR